MKTLFVVGAPKAGTTKLVDSLSQHPQIAASNPKENNFYSHKELASRGNYYNSWLCDSQTKYARCFEINDNTRWLCDGSVSYFDNLSACTKISKIHKESKIIIIIRDPIERAISHYLMDRRLGYISTDLKNILNQKKCLNYHQYFGISKYYKYIKTYRETFGKNNVHIFSFNEFFKNYESSLSKIFNLLEVDDISQRLSNEKINDALIPKFIGTRKLYKNNFLRQLVRYLTTQKFRHNLKKFSFIRDPGIFISADLYNLMRSELEDDFNNTIKYLEENEYGDFARIKPYEAYEKSI